LPSEYTIQYREANHSHQIENNGKNDTVKSEKDKGVLAGNVSKMTLPEAVTRLDHLAQTGSHVELYQ
jgi:hypothetical protein